MPPPRQMHEIIDLTDDQDAVGITASPTSFPNAAQPNGHHRAFSQGMPSGRGEGPPPKRQKTEESTDMVRMRVSCLEQQVFPHIDQELLRLDSKRYDLDRLVGILIQRVVDKEFEHLYSQGNGRLSPSHEALVAVKVSRTVTELAAGHEFLRPPPPTPRAPTPRALAPRPPAPRPPAPRPPAPRSESIVPSIERESQEPSRQTPSVPLPIQPPYDSPYGLLRPIRRVNGVRPAEPVEPVELVEPVEPPLPNPTETDTSPPPPRPRTPRLLKKKQDVITPQRQRARVKASQWQSGRAYQSKREGSPVTIHSPWFHLQSYPYMKAEARWKVTLAPSNRRALALEGDELQSPQVFHVDFTAGEVKYLQQTARRLYGKLEMKQDRAPPHDLRHLLKKVPRMIASLVELHAQGYGGAPPPPTSLTKRKSKDVEHFLYDLYRRKLEAIPKCLFIERDDGVSRGDAARASRVPSLLLTREISGNRMGYDRVYRNFNTAFKSNREDYFEGKLEWTNCAGDIMTMTWLSNDHFLCGTTTHSDAHNQQYNKPGNLLLGSAVSNSLRAYPDHRILRPIITHGDNALESMRESQDPWLFTSVVSSDYEASNELAFTSSFDKTVKVWKLSGDAMEAVGSWPHGGRVNFVVASKNGSGSIATAADVPTEAVRVYHLNSARSISESQFDVYSCTRVHDEDYVPSEKWAYFPSAIRWGIHSTVSHLLLIGYSPRSLTGDDNEIPEDKRESGELCLWDTVGKTQVKVNCAKTQNVFEVVWHPTRAAFVAATSATQTLEKIEEHARTQIRIFELNETGQYAAIKTLDCPAADINEISIRPNSVLFSYIAAGCTDGKVYVWDSAGSDLPKCVLKHGDPVEELIGDREMEDVGVKFLAWGTTTDRFYTGSSDGVVKVWNIRSGKGVLVKDLIEVAAPITVGAFSPDYTKLAIGDGSGRVYLIALEDSESESSTKSAATSSGFFNLQLAGRQQSIRCPRPFIPHPEVPHPNDLSGRERARQYLANSHLALYPDPTIGVIQGPNYIETGLFRAEAHLNRDVCEPLLSAFESHQQANQMYSRTHRFPRQRSIDESELARDLRQMHLQNDSVDFSPDRLDPQTRADLEKEGAELEATWDDFDYETDIDTDATDSDVEMPDDQTHSGCGLF
ncbi:WD40 repeat-like protein [Xylariomycetidae sp. FL0641]|nr:WD40 repeat-like protein [Xylariomycetidae sp. FL0641]